MYIQIFHSEIKISLITFKLAQFNRNLLRDSNVSMKMWNVVRGVEKLIFLSQLFFIWWITQLKSQINHKYFFARYSFTFNHFFCFYFKVLCAMYSADISIRVWRRLLILIFFSFLSFSHCCCCCSHSKGKTKKKMPYFQREWICML